jgi:DNA-binding MarR family transcriptional regulator
VSTTRSGLGTRETSEAHETEMLAAALNHEIARHGRLVHVMKSQMASLVPEGLDMAAFSLLFTLVRCGPKRQGELAELALLDPSTVSRHVAQLARAGYVQRRPDPEDGRAVQLVATEAGDALAAEIGRRRQLMLTRALTAWAPEDLRRLVTLMARLNDDLDAFRPHFVRAMVDPDSDPDAEPDPDPDPPADPHADPPGNVAGPLPDRSDPVDVPDPRNPDQEFA